ncbi:MAG: GHKL domain-containing protein [Clostridia bacterium]|nr:GHKL domain-containing protein [Clostridia bacterium]
MYNQTLNTLQENLHSFKHDYSNTLQCIGGYIYTNNMEGLKDYYLQLLDDCQKINNLTVLSPSVINNPAIYNIIASKYMKAENLNIKINLDIFFNLKELCVDSYTLSRILGILLDNAIEAANDCENKVINISFSSNNKKGLQIITIENTFNHHNLNTNELFKKGFSTKKNNTGLGLFNVRKILNKSKNLNLFTSINNGLFSQSLEIWMDRDEKSM